MSYIILFVITSIAFSLAGYYYGYLIGRARTEEIMRQEQILKNINFDDLRP